MATAMMFRIDTARPTVGGVHLEVIVCFSGMELPYPDVRMIEFDIDPSQSTTQIQTAMAEAIRSAGAALGYAIPTNAVNVVDYSKG